MNDIFSALRSTDLIVTLVTLTNVRRCYSMTVTYDTYDLASLDSESEMQEKRVELNSAEQVQEAKQRLLEMGFKPHPLTENSPYIWLFMSPDFDERARMVAEMKVTGQYTE